MPETDLILYQSSRAKVERQDFGHFLGLYGGSRLPAGQGLKAMFGKMVFCIEGYDADVREIYVIPEVRRFYSAFHTAWLFCLYFCNLDTDGLNSVVICCLNSFTALKVEGQAACRVEYDPLELIRFIAHDFPHVNWMCELAGLDETAIFNRTRDVFRYFQLPIDA